MALEAYWRAQDRSRQQRVTWETEAWTNVEVPLNFQDKS